MPPIECFWIEPIARVRVGLRRFIYTSDKVCSATGSYCNAVTPVGDFDYPMPDYDDPNAVEDIYPLHGANDYPEACEACHEPFDLAVAQNQVSTNRLYQSEGGGLYTLRNAPPGAMFRAWWLERTWKGPDGHCLALMLPGGIGEWIIDGPASNGPGWQRTGTPPKLTATPSIGRTDKNGQWLYHGWLRDGYLVDV